MSGIPSGTVTFLFTDIEGSAKQWEEHSDEMSAALAMHDNILSTVIEQNDGYIFKTLGDAFCAAFANPRKALEAAIQCQRALRSASWPSATGPLRVRMALNTGVVEPQQGDYLGPPVNRVARLLSAAHGAQVLLSMSCYQIVRDDLPRGVVLIDLLEHRLKDLVRPEHIFQLSAPGLESDFPPLRTVDVRPNNLPLQLTHMVGRARELEAISRLLLRPNVRLVTLTGAGGTGKTRLAVQAAAEIIEHFTHGAFFISLASISHLAQPAEPDPVVVAIAQALDVREASGQRLEQALKEYLSDKQMLLVLDNFEQIVSSAPVVYDLLMSSPHLKVLVTSRSNLHIRGEREYVVPPLQLPPAHAVTQGTRSRPPGAGALSQYEAVELFVERALDVKPDFQVTNSNAPAVAEICHRLDGLPLAIELAAARIRLFSPQALLDRLGSRLTLLTGGAQDLPPRQRTLRNTIEWSYDLLSEEEKKLFRRMAVFVGGRSLEAIDAVCAGGPARSASGASDSLISDSVPLSPLSLDLLEGVTSLVQKSMLQPYEGPAGEPRFWMLETIHEYAEERLRQSPEEEAAVRARHAGFFLRFAEEARPHLRAVLQVEWLNRLEAEHDNLRVALHWTQEQAEQSAAGVRMALRLNAALQDFWHRHGHLTEGREWLSKALSRLPAGSLLEESHGARDGDLTRAHVDALIGAGVLAFWQGDYTVAYASFERALVLARELKDDLQMAAATRGLGELAHYQDDYKLAHTLFEQSFALSRSAHDDWSIAKSLSDLGYLNYRSQRYAEARSSLEESLELFEKLGDKAEIAAVSWRLARISMEEGNYSMVRHLLQQALTYSGEVGDKLRLALSLNTLGELERLHGVYASAASFYEEALAHFQQLSNKWNMSVCLHNLGHIALREEGYERARDLFTQSLAICTEVGDKTMVASCLAGFGGLAGAMRRAMRAARLFGAAQALLQSIETKLDVADTMEYERNRGVARAQLSEDTWEEAWREGQAMSIEEAIAYAREEGD